MDSDLLSLAKAVKSHLDQIFIPDDFANEIVISAEESGGREFDFVETYGLLSAKIDEIVSKHQKK